MKSIMTFITRLFAFMALMVGLSAPLFAAPNPFNISEDELNQIVDALNDLSPDQLKELEELGRATEERMRSQNLDPNNPNDWMKFMENEGLAQQSQMKRPAARPKPPAPKPRPRPRQRQRPRPRPQRPMPSKPASPAPVPVVSQADTKQMIDELIKHLESLKQKAITRTTLSKRLGTVQDQVDQFGLYLNLVNTPDIITLLSSKDFDRLRDGLEGLHKSFVSLEPSISARERSPIINEDDPYEVLDLPYSATEEEIEARFTDLSSERSPDAVKAQLEAEGCENAVCNRMVKTADRTFRLITRSYEKLKDPETRKKVDEQLTDKISRETAKEQISLRAFDQLFTAMGTAFTQGRIVTELKQLLEKYKPQELEKAQKQQQLEKEAYERSKRRVIVPMKQPSLRGRPTGPYDSFYRKMGQGRYGRRPAGRRQQPAQRGRPQRRQQPSRAKAPAGKKEQPKPSGAKPAAKPGTAPQKKEVKKDTKKKQEKPKPVTIQPTGKDLEVMTEVKAADGILGKAKGKKNKLEIKYETRGEEKVDTYTLKGIMSDVRDQLTKPGERAPSSPEQLMAFYKDYNLEGLAKHLKKIVPPEGKKLSDAVKYQWNESAGKNSKVVTDLYNLIFKQLDKTILHNDYNAHISPAKEKYYGLDRKRVSKSALFAKDDNKDEGPPTPESGFDLGKVRDTVYAIKVYYDTITKAAK